MTDSLMRTILGEKLNYYENQIDFNDFDPNLSFKIDKIITLIESRKSAEHVWHFDDP